LEACELVDKLRRVFGKRTARAQRVDWIDREQERKMNIARVAAQRSGRLASQAIRNQNMGKQTLPDVEFMLAQRTVGAAKTSAQVNRFSKFMVVKYYV